MVLRLNILVSTLIALAITSLFIGAADLSMMQVITSLFYDSEFNFIVNEYRIPRLILAMCVGAGLGLSGVLVQGVIRNPLASPDLMGVSAGAGLAATSLLVFYPDAPLYLLPISAVIGGLFAASIIGIAARLSQPSPARLALIGIAISAFLSSCIDFLIVINPIEINTAMIWLTGSLWGRNWQQVPYIFVSLMILLPMAFWLAWRLDIMGLGEDSAISLGVNVSKMQMMALTLAVLLASLSVSVAGTISFVGLLSPHLARLLFGHSHKLLIIASALLGALLVLLSDMIARGIQPPIELPAGVLTSLIGAPYFIYLLYRYKGW